MDWTILWWLLAGLLVIAGVIPALPGVPLVFAGLFVGAWIGHFETISWITVSVLALLAVIAWAVDFLAGAFGARYLGASSRAFWGATFGAIAGLFFGLPGAFPVSCSGHLSAPCSVNSAVAATYSSPAAPVLAHGSVWLSPPRPSWRSLS